MKLNREKAAAALAAILLAWSLVHIVAGVVAPGRELRVDVTLPNYRPELIPRTFRTFKEEEPIPRNPFSVSEGWQGLEILPMAPPPVPPAPRPLPTLGGASDPAAARFVWTESVPAAAPKGGAP